MYSKPSWAKFQITRETGLIEDICSHGVGHPNDDFIKTVPEKDWFSWSVHGCCGCCIGQETGQTEDQSE